MEGTEWSTVSKPVIVCVDDEKDILDSLFRMLGEFKADYDIELAESGEEALEIYDECCEENIPIPLIITDFLMPGMKGDELLITLHKKDPAMIKMLLTGQATLEGVRNAYEHANLYRYLSKPWERQDLVLTIKEALKSYTNEKKLLKAEQKYKRIFDHAVEGIFQTTLEGRLIVVNPALAELMGYSSPEEALSLIENVASVYVDPGARDLMLRNIGKSNSVAAFETRVYKKDGTQIWVEIFIGPLYDEQGKIEKLEGFIRDVSEKKAAEKEIENYQKHLESLVEERTAKLEEKSKQINDNIIYAQRIQASILPDKKHIDAFIKNFFIIWNPKDKVGGDFYWFKETKGGCMLALADCTGHGVSGAFMTMIAYSELNRITDEVSGEDPSAILQELNKNIKRTLNKEKKEEYADDGLDIALCYIPVNENYFIYAGAKMSLFIVKDHKASRIKGDKQSIGYKSSKAGFVYTNHTISISDSSRFYLSSDGYLEQLGGKKRRSFGMLRFCRLLEDIQDQPLDKQKHILLQTQRDYIGKEYEQVDDVTVIGFSL